MFWLGNNKLIFLYELLTKGLKYFFQNPVCSFENSVDPDQLASVEAS